MKGWWKGIADGWGIGRGSLEARPPEILKRQAGKCERPGARAYRSCSASHVLCNPYQSLALSGLHFII